MLLETKNAVIYGAGGAVGGAVAQAFARNGARVFLTGRTLARLDPVAETIRAAGGQVAGTAVVDALDQRAVERHVAGVVEQAGGIQVTFNAIDIPNSQAVAPLIDLPPDDVSQAVRDRVATNHITARAAGRHMVSQGSGVILMITATPARMAFPRSGSFGVEGAAVEGLCRTLASELGPHGVRVICLRSAGSPESPGVDESLDIHGGERAVTDLTLLRRLPTLAEVANVAAFMASDHASAMTGTVANVTAGSIVD